MTMNGISMPLTCAESLEPLWDMYGCCKLDARAECCKTMVDVMPIFDLSSAGKMSIR
jgi:hypothetical protein